MRKPNLDINDTGDMAWVFFCLLFLIVAIAKESWFFLAVFALFAFRDIEIVHWEGRDP